MARICAAWRPVLTGKGFLFWLLLCAPAVSVDGALGAPLAPSRSPIVFHPEQALLLRIRSSRCGGRADRDSRDHRRSEACREAADDEDSLEFHGSHDRRTSTRKNASERGRKRRRASRMDDHDAGENQADEKEAALSPRIREPRKRSLCRQGDRRWNDAECDDRPPPPYKRDSGKEPVGDEGDALTRPYCGMLCMWRRAKYGHCGIGCSYYRRRYENEGDDEWRRHRRRRRDRDDYYDADRDLLK
jgi:hypothetical protein